MKDRSDDELMRLSGQGDARAFAQLVERHLGRAGGFAARMLGSASEAEDIVQEAFMRAWQKAPDWRPQAQGGAQFSTWFYRALVNLAIDRRRRGVPAALEAAGEIADPAPDGFDRAAGGEIARRVAAALAALPERQRAAFALCHYDGMSNIDAAAALGISVGALESLLVRARRAMRAALADLLDGVPERALP